MAKSDQNSKTLSVGIVGLGPVGLTLSFFLKSSGCKVSVFDLDKIKLNRIRENGVNITGETTNQVYVDEVSSSPIDLLPCDVLFLCLKTYQCETFIKNYGEEIKLWKDQNSSELKLVSAQNGIDSELIISDCFGESETLRMVMNFGVNLSAPNTVKINFFNPPHYIASLDDSCREMAETIAQLMSSSGMTTVAIDSFELLRRIWEKTILNSSLSALCGLGKFTITEAMAFPDTVEVIEQVIEEAVEVAASEKIFFEDDFIRKCMRYLKKGGNHIPSMAGDIINQRPTEIDYFNGKFVEYGRKHYIRTSLNLVFTNVVKALSSKNINNQISKIGLQALSNTKGKLIKKSESDGYFVGVDLGSAYTKFTVIDEFESVCFQTAIQTKNRDKIALKHVMDMIRKEYQIEGVCATGYGRKKFHESDLVKTEIMCVAEYVSHQYPGAKNIVDIGGEDIKIIKCDQNGNVSDFYLNDKCAAGTGSFLVEAAEKAEISIKEMSDLAAKSGYNHELNSFCTVFAKTEITGWLIDGKPVEDIARGIYKSIVNRLLKMRIDKSLPVYMVGGVIAHHPYMSTLLKEKLGIEVNIVSNPQFCTSNGAAIMVLNQFKSNKNIPIEKILIKNI